MTSLKPWPCRRFSEGGPAVLPTVETECPVFQKTAYSCSVISKFVIQLQPTGLFFMKTQRVTSRILATVVFSALGGPMQLRKRSSAFKRRLWESDGASEVEAKTYEKLEAILGAPNEAPRRLEVDLAPPCAVFIRIMFFRCFSRFPKRSSLEFLK